MSSENNGWVQKFDYFIDRTEKDFAKLNRSVEDLDVKVESLIGFKRYLIGASAVISGLVTLIVDLFYK